MRVKIIEFGIKLNGRYGVTGELIADLTDEQLISQMENAIVRNRNNPYSSEMIVCSCSDMKHLVSLKENMGMEDKRLSVCFRKPFGCEAL